MRYIATALVASFLLASACKSSGRSDAPSIFSMDETTEAGKIVASAKEDLTKIKVLYKDNEGKREEIKKAMEIDDAKKVRELADSVNDLINGGVNDAQSAIDKIEKAQEMQINDDYREYLRLKEESLKRELEAFENYRQAARTLRDNYDPKNAAMRDKVKEDFKNRVENYRKLMEEARDYSNQANTIAKEVLRKQQAQ
jgi:tetratricopeptide (TPR) repeat protein